MFHKFSIKEFELFVVISRKIWLRRNMVVHDREYSDPNQLVKGTIDSIGDFEKAQVKESDQSNELVFSNQQCGGPSRRDTQSKLKYNCGYKP